VRLRIPFALLVALGLAVWLVPASTARAPARAHAEARMAAGDLGTVGRAIADGDARRRADGSAAELGLQIQAGSALARA
jgi:hypothetical protein